jgi:hypothetical protein
MSAMSGGFAEKVSLFTKASCYEPLVSRAEFLKEMWAKYVVLWLAILPLAIASFPVDCVHRAWCCCWRRPTENTDRANVIDFWHISALTVSLVILFCVAPYVAKSLWRWVLLLPMLRACDLFYTLMALIVYMKEVRDPARAIILAMVHYWELAVIFACSYLAFFFQHQMAVCPASMSGRRGLFLQSSFTSVS